MSIYSSSSFSLSSLSFGISKLGQHQANIAQSLERLSTGKQINRASDDPSGLIVSTKLKASQLSLQRRLTSFERESSYMGAQEGGLSVLSELLIDLNALTVSSASTATTTQQEQDANKDSASSIINAINQITNSTTFQGSNILSGFAAANLGSIMVETTNPETGDPQMVQMTLADLPQLLDTNPKAAQDLAEQAISKIAGRRGAIGNRIRSIESESRILQSELTNTTEVLSDIQDTDFAVESAKLVRAQILEQATTQSMLIQRKQVESMLDLLTNSTNQLSSTPPVSLRS
ncbi:MAG: hypothetical protein JKY43_02185 [Phycisphaerales bacterium]|nr:hypothetical protein [Phycisphaerales bacterium]